MRVHQPGIATFFAMGMLALSACEQTGLPEADSALTEPVAYAAAKKLDVDQCAFGQTFTLDSGNPYFPLDVGRVWWLNGREDDVFVELRITVLDETEVVGGVTTRVVEEVEWEDGTLLEHSRNFVAVAPDGTVCYFGEDVDVFDDGSVSHPGAWRADQPGNFPGILMPAEPLSGMKFLMEGAPGRAEDHGTIVGSGPVRVPAGRFQQSIRVREVNPLDGDWDFKVYVSGIGLVVDGPLSLVDYAPAAQAMR